MKTKDHFIIVNPKPGENDIIFNPDKTYGSVTDINSNFYRTIQIGTQNWMSENLKTSKFNDGTSIPDYDNTYYSETLAYIWYLGNEAKYKKSYGALYNWYAITTDKLCPIGWHVPSESEWTTLVEYIGDYENIGQKLKETGNSHWISSTQSNNTNESGFTAHPGGMHTSTESVYLREIGSWWSTSPNQIIFTLDYDKNYSLLPMDLIFIVYVV